MNEERWAPIAVHGYQVSDHGRVMGPLGKIRKARIIKGVWVVDIGRNKTTLSVHVLVAKAFVTNPHGLPYVRWKDGDQLNSHYTNLFWKDKFHHDGVCRKCGRDGNDVTFRTKQVVIKLKNGTLKKYRRKTHVCNKCDYQKKKKRLFNKILNHEIPHQLKSAV